VGSFCFQVGHFIVHKDLVFWGGFLPFLFVLIHFIHKLVEQKIVPRVFKKWDNVWSALWELMQPLVSKGWISPQAGPSSRNALILKCYLTLNSSMASSSPVYLTLNSSKPSCFNHTTCIMQIHQLPFVDELDFWFLYCH